MASVLSYASDITDHTEDYNMYKAKHIRHRYSISELAELLDSEYADAKRAHDVKQLENIKRLYCLLEMQI